MRFFLAFLLAITAVVSANAQGRPAQGGSSQVNPAQGSPVQGSTVQANPTPQSAKQAEEILRQRILLREKFNKGWEVQDEDPRQRRARCKSEARKQFTAMHPLKRRKFQKECMAKAGR
jgi:hypothetical protein